MINLVQLMEPVSELWSKFRLTGDWRGVRFLCYHSVADNRHSVHPYVKNLFISTKEFRDHLKYFQQLEIPVVSMDSAIELLENREAEKGRYICLTFDDGDMDHYTTAWKILKEFGFSAHFSVVADFVGKSLISEYDGCEWARNFMGKDEIKTILKEGGTIGCHGKTHSILTGLERNKLVSEVKNSKDQIEELVGVPIFTFAYPGALYDKTVINSIRQAGYKYAFNINYGSVRSLNERNRYSISRNLIHGNYDQGNYLTFRGGYDWAKYYLTIKTKIKSKPQVKRITILDGDNASKYQRNRRFF